MDKSNRKLIFLSIVIISQYDLLFFLDEFGLSEFTYWIMKNDKNKHFFQTSQQILNSITDI